MEDQSAPLEASNDEVKKLYEADVSAHQAGDFSMPICFLVKEQAKSHVAIQDLQKRVESVENIQYDVIDSLAEIRKFLCNKSKTCSGLNFESLNASSEIPSNCVSKSGSFSNSTPTRNAKETNLPTAKESASLTRASEYSHKLFESKTKESALESDKQDSGLDSDHLSLNKHFTYWGKQESGDELLQLLDEISERTEVLQKQLSIVEQKSGIVDDKPATLNVYTDKSDKIQNIDGKESPKLYATCLDCSKQTESLCMKGNMACGESPDCFEGQLLSDPIHKMQKRSANKIDSAMVSCILKETSVVELQRQVLIYVVENAVLHTKMNELNQLLSTESNQVESVLKDEARLLMMENRELRISLDEQKLETNSLRSKVLMLERVLQSISVENRELTWQLSEFLGIQNVTKKEPCKFSSSYTYGDPATSKFTRRPTKFSGQNETNVNCVKSKLLSNASSFLDVTVEEPEQLWPIVQTPTAFETHGGPVQSSTPVTPLTKLKDVKMGCISQGGSNLQSIKKRFKSIERDSVSSKNLNFEKCIDEFPHDTPPSDTCVKNSKLNATHYDDTTPKFPFNSILEKLKANSDYRLSRRTSLVQENEIRVSDNLVKASHRTKLTEAPPENLRQSNSVVQGRKGKNIHQRIQNILDRIMSESEDPS